jgi:hypothetical protein
MDLLEIGLSVVDWIGLDQDRDKWRALANALMNEEWCLLGCSAVWLLYETAFRRNLTPP